MQQHDVLDAWELWKQTGQLVPIAGGDNDPPADDPPADDPPADDPPTDDKDLPENAKKALAVERAAREKAEKDAKAQAKTIAKLQGDLKKLSDTHATDDEKKINAAKEEAKKEAMATVGRELLEAKILAAAAGKISKPELAVKLIAPDLTIGDDGKIDTDEVKAAVEAFVKDNPELAVKAAGGKSGGDPQNGKKDDKIDMDTLLRRASGRA